VQDLRRTVSSSRCRRIAGSLRRRLIGPILRLSNDGADNSNTVPLGADTTTTPSTMRFVDAHGCSENLGRITLTCGGRDLSRFWAKAELQRVEIPPYQGGGMHGGGGNHRRQSGLHRHFTSQPRMCSSLGCRQLRRSLDRQILNGAVSQSDRIAFSLLRKLKDFFGDDF
jgi:hypothetical protein